MSVRFEDHSDAIRQRIAAMLADVCENAAEKLTDKYSEKLSRQQAPPHSRKDRTPYAYNGWIRGGYGPVNEETTVNNIPPFFSAIQQESLYTYLRSSGGEIGFLRQGHVTRRDQNYLIQYSTRTDGQRREWVVKEYRKYKSELRNDLRAQIMANRVAAVGQSDVPF